MIIQPSSVPSMTSPAVKTRCRTKIIVNPKVTKGFSLKFEPESNLVILKILIQDTSGIYAMFEQMKKLLLFPFNWEIEWNWKNTPLELQEDPVVKETISQMFSNDKIPQTHDPEEVNRMMVQLWSQVQAANPQPQIPAGSEDTAKTEPAVVGTFPTTVLSPKWGPKFIPTQVVGANLSAQELDVMASQVKMHVLSYHQNPDMTGLVTLKKQTKAHNYICSVLGRHDLSLSQSMYVAGKVAQSLLG